MSPDKRFRFPAMRVLAITNIYPTARFPGRGVFVQEQIKGLRSSGVEVRVLFVDRWQEGPTVYYRLQGKIRNAVTEFDPDVIHLMYGGVMADQIVGRSHLRPVVVTFHGSDLLGENLSGWARKLISGYGVYCSRKAAKAAERVIVVAQHLGRALYPPGQPEKIRLSPCCRGLEALK